MNKMDRTGFQAPPRYTEEPTEGTRTQGAMSGRVVTTTPSTAIATPPVPNNGAPTVYSKQDRDRIRALVVLVPLGIVVIITGVALISLGILSLIAMGVAAASPLPMGIGIALLLVGGIALATPFCPEPRVRKEPRWIQ